MPSFDVSIAFPSDLRDCDWSQRARALSVLNLGSFPSVPSPSSSASALPAVGTPGTCGSSAGSDNRYSLRAFHALGTPNAGTNSPRLSDRAVAAVVAGANGTAGEQSPRRPVSALVPSLTSDNLAREPQPHSPKVVMAQAHLPSVSLCGGIVGAWDANTCGGCTNFHTWRRNPQFSLTIKPTPGKRSVEPERPAAAGVSSDSVPEPVSPRSQDETVEIVITLTRKAVADAPPPSSTTNHPVALYVLRRSESLSSLPLPPNPVISPSSIFRLNPILIQVPTL